MYPCLPRLRRANPIHPMHGAPQGNRRQRATRLFYAFACLIQATRVGSKLRCLRDPSHYKRSMRGTTLTLTLTLILTLTHRTRVFTAPELNNLLPS